MTARVQLDADQSMDAETYHGAEAVRTAAIEREDHVLGVIVAQEARARRYEMLRRVAKSDA